MRDNMIKIPTLESKELTRFWSKVDKSQLNDCWNWTSTRLNKPLSKFPTFQINNIKYKAHRVAFSLAGGSLTGKSWLSHRCGNTRCVNPHHLFLVKGEDGRNIQPRNVVNLGAKRKLSETKCLEIIRRYETGTYTYKAISIIYGVSAETIRRLILSRSLSEPKKLKARFFKRIEKDITGCWIWKGAINSCGYGVMRIPNSSKIIYAHRIGYELYKAPILSGKRTRKTCNVKLCVNPGHMKII